MTIRYPVKLQNSLPDSKKQVESVHNRDLFGDSGDFILELVIFDLKARQ